MLPLTKMIGCTHKIRDLGEVALSWCEGLDVGGPHGVMVKTLELSHPRDFKQ